MIERLVKKYAYKKNCQYAKDILGNPEKMDFLKKEWPKYRYYAEIDLKCSFMDFYAEMSTFLYLSANTDHKIKSFRVSNSGFQRNEGPDLYVENTKTWVECISPSKITSYDRALRIFDRSLDFSHLNQAVLDKRFYIDNGLRFLNPILSKYKKYKKYIGNGIVSSKDTKLISICLQKIGTDFNFMSLEAEIRNLLDLLCMDAVDGILVVFGELSDDRYLYVENSHLKRVH